MALVKPYIFQFVGFQNSGKTTLVRNIIQQLTNKGNKIVTIKHHGHGGKPNIDENKDSSLHIMSGAAASLVEGEGRVIIHGEKMNGGLTEQIQLMSFFNPDFIFVEGYKNESYPKVVIIRNEEDEFLLTKLNNIKFILYWDKKPSQLKNIPIFYINDNQAKDYVINFLLKQYKMLNEIG